MPVLRTDLSLQQMMLRVHFHSCNEVHTLHSPVSELSEVVVTPVQGDNGTGLQIDFLQAFAVIVSGYCHVNEAGHEIRIIQQYMESFTPLFFERYFAHGNASRAWVMVVESKVTSLFLNLKGFLTFSIFVSRNAA